MQVAIGLPRPERSVFPELKNRDDLVLPCGSEEDEAVLGAQAAVRAIVRANAAGPALYLQQYEPYKRFLGTAVQISEEETAVLEFLAKDRPLAAHVQYIKKLEALAAEIGNLRRSAPLGLYSLCTEKANATLTAECARLVDLLISSVVEKNRKLNRSICERFDTMANRLMDVPESSDDMTQLDEYLQTVKSDTIYRLKVSQAA